MSVHKPVLLKEAIEMLNLKEGMTVVDATLGAGGYSRSILSKIGENGVLVAIDLDKEAAERFIAEITNDKLQISNKFQSPKFLPAGRHGKIQRIKNIILVNDNFSRLSEILEVLNIEKVDAIAADLGWSSDQMSGKGMSFSKDEKLDMRLDGDQKLSAYEVINEYSQKDIEKILREYGEEKFWKNIARKIIDYRKIKKIETTRELAEIVSGAIPKKFWKRGINPATKTFQAIRIEVNQELENLKNFLPSAIEALNQKGRLAVISFHSLEDRIVKNNFRENARGCICPPNFPQCVCGKKPAVSIVTKKPVAPGEEETSENPRARSAKMRVCEKI